MKDDLVTPVQAAKQLGVGLDFIYVLVRSGKLKARKIAGRWRIPSAEVEARRKSMEQRNGTIAE